ncbi:protein PLASTID TRANSCRIPTIONALLY ACTIVE 12, chloroplastic isoform X1 [Zea mays]|uniref:Protein PLASTID TRANSCRIPTIONALLY ACTIVE 12, chloroplastic n=1 Tax=Zea mays TaxID=4577 RepID=PTA12_MAIZE|nr:protein PLASTID TRANSCRIPTIONALLY ACTIVE 12, chloroplastic isoform X1 [Zea mays]B4FZ81.1 RecName: Full=Protein PLASTID TRANSCRIPTIONALLY ACTIVE 12, chloroplastic; Short=ZmpTAC12; Flags: Precursor [Zea mays]ACF87424.1 unknown [Zea mays]ONM37552.1 plastid transcriptionally active chromosome 12-like protein [Zea mays]|eukprot:XP_008672559.1 protein PLASTID TRANSCRIPTIONALLY ACTIVE 12, chloroplastic isoform X1 [Zea mays]
MASCYNPWRLFPGMSTAVPAGPVTAPAHSRTCKSSKVFSALPHRRGLLFLGTRRARIKCVKDDSLHFDPSKIEPPPYSSYFDSTSGQLEPASGARASIPGKEYWPEGTAARVRAARAPAPVGESAGMPSFGTKPGSRRRGYKEQVTSASGTEGAQTDDRKDGDEPDVAIIGSGDDALEEIKDSVDEYVIYETPEEEELSEYDMDKMMGRPHPFIDPAKAMSLGEPKTSEELWWHWRRKSQEEEMWSRWQRRRPDVDTVFAKAMAETGQIKIFGDHPSRTEAALAKTRRHLYKEERLEAEQRRLEEIGPIAYYSEWVEAYKNKDTSREAIQKHFEETGEDENVQLIKMFQHQTAGEYRIMMGTDVRIQRDPLAMRMREDQIKQIWGGDPVYPTINYVQDPDEVIDYRGPEFHEPTPEVVPYLMEHGIMITKEELYARLNEEREDVNQDITYIPEAKDPMATAIDIGEHSYNEDSDDEDEDVDKAAAQPQSLEDEEDDRDDVAEVEEKVNQNWSALKSTGQAEKPKEKSKKDEMTLKEAIDDSENLTDFLMDFEETE